MSAEQQVPVFGLDGSQLGLVKLPSVFQTAIRPDLIRRAVISALTARIQPKGRDPMAGKRTTAESLGPGYDLSRVPRVKGEMYPKAGMAAFAPFTVKGRMTFPLTTEKIYHERINVKERRLALKSAIAATANKSFVEKRGHVIEGVPHIPLIVSDELQKVSKAKELKKILEKLSLTGDLMRAKEGIRIRAGKGKMRGRKYKVPKSILFVIAKDEGIRKAARNFPGVDVATVEELNVLLLAPGGHPGRLTVWTESALRKLEDKFKAA